MSEELKCMPNEQRESETNKHCWPLVLVGQEQNSQTQQKWLFLGWAPKLLQVSSAGNEKKHQSHKDRFLDSLANRTVLVREGRGYDLNVFRHYLIGTGCLWIM